MNIRFLLVVLLALFTKQSFSQKIIEAKDAYKHAGNHVLVVGKIISAAGPGYLDDISIYLVTDSTEMGLAVTIPYKIWSKYGDRKGLLAADIRGKKVKVYGKIERYGEHDPFINIEKAADLKLLPK